MSSAGFAAAKRLVALLMLLALCGSLAAGPRVLKYNISPGGYPPYIMEGADGKPSGILGDAFVEAAESLGYRVEAVAIPPKRVAGFLLSGRIDVTSSAIEWTQNPERFVFSPPLLETHDVIVAAASRPLAVQTVRGLEGKTLMTQLGFLYPVIDGLVAAGKVRRVDVQGERELLDRTLHSPMTDAGVMDYRVARWFIWKHFARDDFQLLDMQLPRVQYRLKFGPHWRGRLDPLAERLVELRDNGVLTRIVERYLPEGEDWAAIGKPSRLKARTGH